MNMQAKRTFNMKLELDLFILKLKRIREDIVRWIVWKLPKEIVMWCCYRVAANATSGEYGNVAPSELLFFDMMSRWKSE